MTYWHYNRIFESSTLGYQIKTWHADNTTL